MDIHVDAAERDARGDDDPDYWKQTDATRQFQQVGCRGSHCVLHECTQHHSMRRDILNFCMLFAALLDKEWQLGWPLTLYHCIQHAACDSTFKAWRAFSYVN